MIPRPFMIHSIQLIRCTRLATASVTLLFAMTVSTAGQDKVGELTDDQQTALGQITEPRVASTVGFLASDEMGGRGTGTLEFRIAAAYVASRFRAAGLKGGGENESFYQFAEVESFRVPATGVTFRMGSVAQSSLGMLSATNEALDFSGQIPTANLNDRQQEFEGPAFVEAPESYNGPRGFGVLFRDVNRLRRNGATAIILKVKAGHDLIGMAKQFRSQDQIGRSRLALPILLVTENVDADAVYSVKLPAKIRTKSKMRNVIGILKGSDPELSKQAILISAHLDHLGTRQSGGADPIFNGADDNATGVTAVLTLADAFAKLKTRPKRTIIFMTFWGEERGLLGSKYWSEKPTWPLEQVTCMINIEMIGRPEAGARNKAWGTGWDQSDLGSLLAVGAKRVGTLVFEHPQFSGRMLYSASDNWPLVQKGVIAHSFSAGSLHSDYHQPSDEFKKLETEHMTAVIKGLFAGALPIANGQMTPKKAETN